MPHIGEPVQVRLPAFHRMWTATGLMATGVPIAVRGRAAAAQGPATGRCGLQNPWQDRCRSLSECDTLVKEWALRQAQSSMSDRMRLNALVSHRGSVPLRTCLNGLPGMKNESDNPGPTR